MIGTLAVNLFVTTWERRAGRRLGSEVLVADASHTLSDVAVSLGVIASLVIVKLGFEQADGIVALLVAVIIMRTAWGIMRGVLHTLGDAARLPADEVAAVARSVPASSAATPCAPGARGARVRGPARAGGARAPRSKTATPSPIGSRRRCVSSTGRSRTWSCTWSRPSEWPLRDAAR